MEQDKSLRYINRVFRLSGFIAAMIGSYWLIAWLDGRAGQLSVQGSATGTIIMKTNMALCQLLAGLTIVIIGLKSQNLLSRFVAAILSGLVFLISVLTLGEHFFHFDLGIDQLLAKELPGAAGTASPNRMGMIGSFSLTLLGAGLILILVNRRKIASWLGIISCLIILVPSVGYLLDIHSFFIKPLSTGIAWPTVVSLTILGFGLILSNNDGIITMFFSDEPGGLLLRKLLPSILLVPLVIGFLVIRGNHLNLFDIQIGIGGLIIAVILLLLMQAFMTAVTINRANAAGRIAEKELEESEKKYRELVKNAPTGICEVDFRTRKFTSVNDSMCILTGYSRDELLSMSPSEIFDDDGKKAFQMRVDKWLSGQRPEENIEYSVKAKDGHIIYAELNVRFKSDEDGNPLGATVVAHDITERKKLENEIKILAKFPSESPNPVLRLSSEAVILYTNEPGQQVLKTWNTVVGGKVPEEIQKMVKEIFPNGTPGTFEMDCCDKTFFFYAAPVINERYINLYGIDVTERKKSEQALQESEEKYRTIVELSMEGIIIATPDGIFKYVNKRFADMLGYAPEEIIGRSGTEFFYEQEQVVDVKRTRSLLQRGDVMQKDFKFRRKNGSLLYTLYNATPLFDSDGIHIGNLAMHSDITERKNAEEALKKSEERLKQALESGNIGILERDLRTNSVFLDERAAQMFGLDPGTVGNALKFEDLVYEEDILLIEKSLRDSLDNDLPFETIFRVKSKTGTLRYINSKGHIVKDNEGNALKLSGVCSDITDLKEGSEKLILKINEELLRSNKELENFAYVASHDLQEPLRMVSSFTQLLELKYKDKLDNEALEYIHFAVDGSKRMYDLLNGLLAYSRIHTRGKEFERIDLNKVMENAIQSLTLKIRERNAIIKSDVLPVVKGDNPQLIQLFQNIITNGIKFNNNKTPHINISVKSENDYYLISFKDNGIGIEPQYFDRIFRMFQRLLPKDQYEGTGIGLAICKRIVERHGGNMWVESQIGKGSTFYVTISK